MEFRISLAEVWQFLVKVILVAFTAVFPLVVWDKTSEFFETPKWVLLLLVSAILLLLWGVKALTSLKVVISRTPLDLPFLLILIILVISTIFAQSQYTAILGNLPRIHGGLASYLSYILFYFAVVLNLRQMVTSNNPSSTVRIARQCIYFLTLSSIIIAILSLMSYWGLDFLSLPWSKGLNFTLTGSSFSTATLLTLLMPFLVVGILSEPEGSSASDQLYNPKMFTDLAKSQNVPVEMVYKTVLALVLAIFALTIGLTGYIANFLASGVVLLLIALNSKTQTLNKNWIYLVTPVAVTIVITILSILPIAPKENFLYKQYQNFPREVQIPFLTSWKVSVSAFRDGPFWGSGPASYLFDFSFYKPLEANTNNLWNTRFDQAFNEYLYFLGTLGILGLLALLLLTIVFLRFALQSIFSPQSNLLEKGFSLSGVAFIVIITLHPTTMVVWVLGVLIMALFFFVRQVEAKVSPLSFEGIRNIANQYQLGLDALPEITMAIVVLIILGGGYFIGKALVADYHHRLAIVAVAENRGFDAYNELQLAKQINPWAESYRTDLAQTSFALANAIALSKGPTQSSPSGSLNDQDRQNIQVLLSQSIDEAKNATVLSPTNPLNWEILASIYRQVSGVANNALAFSLDAHGRAIQRDPLNPNLRLSVGGIYYSVRNFDLAIRFFTDAVNLKPDFANGYYNLAVALKDKGDLASAVVVAEKTVSLLDPASNDYKTAAAFLSDIKNQQEAKNKSAGSSIPPAAEQTSALQNEKLPKVLDKQLDESKRDKVATPAAVKKPTPTP